MDNTDKKIIIEKFIKDISGEISDIKTLVSFLNIDNEKEKAMIDESIKLFEKKIKKMRKCHTLKEMNKIISIKKILKESNKTQRYTIEE